MKFVQASPSRMLGLSGRQKAVITTDSFIEPYSRRVAAEPLRAFRHLLPSIGSKRNFLTVEMTVKLKCADTKSLSFRCIYVPETIEWE